MKGVLDDMEISKDDYYRDLSISKDHSFQLHLKIKLNF